VWAKYEDGLSDMGDALGSDAYPDRMKPVARTALRAAVVLCGVLAVAWLVQRFVFLPSIPLWWRITCVAAPMILGIVLIELADRLGGTRRSRHRG
jgi:hypothetical protein